MTRIPGMGMKYVEITGVRELDRKLLHLQHTAMKRVAAKGIRASLTVVGQAMRAAVNASAASPELKREARKTVGQRFTRTATRYSAAGAKVGFAVGKKKAAIRKAVAARGKRIAGGKTKGKGVGVSAANIHWFVLGTYKAAAVGGRKLKRGSARGPKAGHPTGTIEGVFGQVTRQALATSAQSAMDAARAVISVEIAKEARKGF